MFSSVLCVGSGAVQTPIAASILYTKIQAETLDFQQIEWSAFRVLLGVLVLSEPIITRYLRSRKEIVLAEMLHVTNGLVTLAILAHVLMHASAADVINVLESARAMGQIEGLVLAASIARLAALRERRQAIDKDGKDGS